MDSHDVDVNVEDKVDWSSWTETVFIRIVHDHVKNGDLQTSTFTKKIWNTISDELLEQCQKRFNLGQLKSKFNRLRKKHREFSDLVAHTRFGWDPVSNTVTASEAVWAEYIKRVPGVKPYRKKGLEHYQTLGEIFNTTTASGHLCFFSSQVPLSSDEDRELEDKFLGHGVHVDIEDDDSMEHLSEPKIEKRHRRPVATSTKRGKKNKSEFDSYFKMTSSVMNARMEMVKCKSAESTSQCIEKWSIKECIEAVEKLGDIDGA
ncbi:Myb DNA-bind 3 domain-containing protein [Citrus sinensis]|uniref:Myb DNA-bind 3 domain-containing protein n=1 Tax=Citrus sinensis TaxID=2711 RepID=A0ACB8I5N2_CITSI|nr:Myb DNA-bind 3 domain-containing protein [Citrus sinensis]